MGLRVAAVDIADDKLKLAKTLGAELVVNAKDEEPGPLGYNLLRIRPNWIVVDTRRRDTESSAFQGDLRWPWTEADGRTVALRDRYSLRR